MESHQRGFTLIELLVVISIVALLSTLAIVSLSSARRKANNAKKQADVNAIWKAVELFYSDQGYYPNSPGGYGSWSGLFKLGTANTITLSSANGFSSSTSGTVYLGTIPPPPPGASYRYWTHDDGAGNISYTIKYGLQTGSDPNHHYAGPRGMDSSDHGGL